MQSSYLSILGDYSLKMFEKIFFDFVLGLFSEFCLNQMIFLTFS